MYDLIITGGKVVDGTGSPPRAADIAISNGLISEIAEPGKLPVSDANVLNAAGAVVTPGFVDPHTHYDGQVTWDSILAPSSWHGVTTAVMGNCGVGFAPAKIDQRNRLIELMEGVEDIPGSALHEGMKWDWETFPEYLDALEKLPRTMDIAAQVPHGPLRLFVMGERGAAQETATQSDLEKMADIVRESIAAGAVAFSTNRMPLHTSVDGEPVPGTFADVAELETLAHAVVEGGGELLQSIPAGAMAEDPHALMNEVVMYKNLAKKTGVKITFSLPQLHLYPNQWRDAMTACRAAKDEDVSLVPQVPGRANGLLLSWETFNPFLFRPAYQEIATLPMEQRLAELLKPQRREEILSQDDADDESMKIMMSSLHSTFAMDEGPVSEPEYEKSIAGRAEAAGVDPVHMLYDAMCEVAQASVGGKTRMMAVFFAGYAEGNLEALGEMMRDELSVVSLGDGGAHCSMICDAGLPTFLLSHWVRDRQRGQKIILEEAVKMLTSEPARLYGLNDRGVIEVGKRADLNIIDLDEIDLEIPEIAHDLPTGAPRILQRARGYLATICAGEVTFRNGQPTGALPGKLVRGRQ